MKYKKYKNFLFAPQD